MHYSNNSMSGCPFASTGSNLTLQEYMKKCLILRPPLDPRYFVPDEESPLFQVDTTPDIILHRYVEDSLLPSSLHQPPPSSQGMFCSQIFARKDQGLAITEDNTSPLQTKSPDIPQLPPDIIEHNSPMTDKGTYDVESQVGEHSLSEIELESNVETETPLSLSVREESVSTSPSSSSLTETSTDTESQSVESPAKSNSPDTTLLRQRLRKKSHLFTKVNIYNVQNGWLNSRDSKKKRKVMNRDSKFNLKRIKSESPELITPKRLKTSKATSDKVKPLSKTLPIIAKDSVETKSVFKKHMSVSAKPWTEHEMECLVVGVNRYGHKWQEIHDEFNFHPSRTHKAMQHKFRAMNKKGDFQRYLKKFRKKAGYLNLSPSQAGDSHQSMKIKESPKLMDIDPTVSNSVHNRQHDQNTKGNFQYWTKEEIKNLEDGYRKFGTKWSRIFESYKFNPTRNPGKLRKKFCRLHPDQLMKKYKISKAMNFLSDKSDPYFLSPCL